MHFITYAIALLLWLCVFIFQPITLASACFHTSLLLFMSCAILYAELIYDSIHVNNMAILWNSVLRCHINIIYVHFSCAYIIIKSQRRDVTWKQTQCNAVVVAALT